MLFLLYGYLAWYVVLSVSEVYNVYFDPLRSYNLYYPLLRLNLPTLYIIVALYTLLFPLVVVLLKRKLTLEYNIKCCVTYLTTLSLVCIIYYLVYGVRSNFYAVAALSCVIYLVHKARPSQKCVTEIKVTHSHFLKVDIMLASCLCFLVQLPVLESVSRFPSVNLLWVLVCAIFFVVVIFVCEPKYTGDFNYRKITPVAKRITIAFLAFYYLSTITFFLNIASYSSRSFRECCIFVDVCVVQAVITYLCLVFEFSRQTNTTFYDALTKTMFGFNPHNFGEEFYESVCQFRFNCLCLKQLAICFVASGMLYTNFRYYPVIFEVISIANGAGWGAIGVPSYAVVLFTIIVQLVIFTKLLMRNLKDIKDLEEGTLVLTYAHDTTQHLVQTQAADNHSADNQSTDNQSIQ